VVREVKNLTLAILITIVLLGNLAVAAVRAETHGQIQTGQSLISAITNSSSTLQARINAVNAQQGQTATSIEALQAAVAQLAGSPAPLQAEFGSVINTIKPWIVKLNVTGAGLRGYGSGVIVKSSGYILTVLHAVDGATSITVTLGTGEALQATIVSRDTAANLALLKMTTTRTDFPSAAMGSINSIVAAQTVIAAGFPLSPDLPGPATFTAGIVAAIRTGSSFYFVQSDADIAPGSGGGGLFTLDGKLVAVSSLAQADGIYLFIPIDAAAQLLAGLS